MSTASPKKRLPTGPISIVVSQPQKAADSGVNNISDIVESGKQESGKQESFNEDLETESKQNTDEGKPDISKKESEENEKQDSIILESGIQEKERVPAVKGTSRLMESTLESIEADDYRKVAMRLSPDAAEQLKALRLKTGIPYEIIVDVLIRRFEDLPENIRQTCLEEAKEIRLRRLVAGQSKALNTTRQRLTV
jgi:hypothetical protein